MTLDPVSDMLTSIRNGLKARLHSVETPASRLKAEVARVLKDAGYIDGVEALEGFPPKLRIYLKYSDRAVPAISEIKRVSKPGLRRFVSVAAIPQVLGGMGLAVLSTSQGVMSGAEAKKRRVGGEVICTVA